MLKLKVRYLGRIISAAGYAMDPAGTKAVEELKDKESTTIGDVR